MIELGLFGFGDLVIYTPAVTFYRGPAASPTRIVSAGSDRPKGTNYPIQVPLTTGIDDYFIKVATNGGNPTPANLSLLVQAAPNNAIQPNDIAIPDDTVGFPLCILDGSQDNTIRKFVYPYSASEQGDVLHLYGNTLMTRNPTDVFIDRLGYFNSDYTFNATILFSPAIGNTEPYIRTNQTTQHWWILYTNDPTLYVFYIDKDGVSHTVENMGDAYGNIGEVAGPLTTSPDESILYWTPRGASVIHAWDLVNHVALPDFAAAVASYKIGDLLTLSNGELIVGYYKASVTRDFYVIHYSTAGAVLHTANFGSD